MRAAPFPRRSVSLSSNGVFEITMPPRLLDGMQEDVNNLTVAVSLHAWGDTGSFPLLRER